MKLKSILLIVAMLAVSVSAWAQGPVAVLYELDTQLTDACLGGGIDPAGTPLPDGTQIKIYWDNDSNGPDANDPRPTLCDLPPTCETGPSGTCPYIEFNINGVEQGVGEGYFFVNESFFTVGVLATPPLYYYRICLPNTVIESDTFRLRAGPQDVDVVGWHCFPDSSCGGCATVPQPQNIAATDTICANVNLTWTYPNTESDVIPGGINRFHVFFGPTFRATIARTQAQTNYQYTDNIIGPGEVGQYRVVAVRQCATDTSSSTATENGGRPPAGVAVTGVSADSACSGDVTVQWSYAQSFVGRFRIKRNNVVVDSMDAVGVPGARSRTLTNLPGRARFCVVAVNTSSPSLCEGVALCDSGGTNSTVPGQVLSVAATGPETPLCDTVRVTWANLVGESGYRILRDGAIINTVAADVTVYNDLAGPCATNSSYTVRAFNSCGDGLNGDTNIGFKNCRPNAVTTVNATDSLYCDSTVVIWTNVASETGYTIYRDIVLPSDTVLTTVAADVVSFRDLTGVQGRSYFYMVRPQNACGIQTTDLTTANHGSKKRTAGVVTGVVATDTQCDGVLVTWTAQAGTDSFRVMRGVDRAGAVNGSTNLFLDTGGNVGQTYAYTVIAFGCGQAAASAADNGIRLQGLVAPAGLTGSMNLCTHVALSWSNITGEDSFQVRRDGLRIGKTNPDVLSFNDSSGTAGTSYQYTVLGFNACGAGSPSVADTGRKLPLPDAVTNLAATVDCGTIHLTWTAAANATSYTVTRNGSAIANAITPTFYDDVPPSQFVDYTYAVQANNACGNRTEGEVIAQARSAPGAPTGFTASETQCAEVVLLWTNPANTDTIRIYREAVHIASVTPPTSSYSDLTAPAGVVQNYRIEARNECGPNTGNVIDTGMRIAGPAEPTGLVATQNYCEAVRLDWNPSSGVVDSYTIRRDGDSVGTTVDTFFIELGLPVGTFSYTVEAISNLCGGTGETDPVSGISLLSPTEPSNVAATTTRCDSVVITWTAAEGNVNGYHIFRDGVEIDAVSGIGNTYYAEVPGDLNVHRYAVRAGSNQCAYSDTIGVNGQQTAGPAQVSGVTATLDRCAFILVQWTPAGGSVDSYTIRRNGEIVATDVGALVSEYFDVAATVGTHSYTVMAVSALCGDGDESSPANGERLTDPPQVQNVEATDNSCENVTVTWDAATGNFDNYRLDRNGGFLDYVELPNTSYIDTSAIAGVTYEYMVCANDSVCGLGPLSVPDNGTRQNGATAPTNLSASDDNCDNILLSWTASSGIFDSYLLYIDGNAPVDLPNNQTTYTHDVEAGFEHTYFLTAISAACGETDSSNVATGLRLPVLGQVVNVDASDDNCDGIALTWDNIVGATTYYIYRDGVLTLYDSSAINSYLDSDVVAGACHDYAVSASNICGPGTASENVNGCRATVPAAPENFIASDDGCFLVGFQWSAVIGATGYIVHWGSEVDSVGAGNVSLEVPAIYPSPVMAWVVAYNACGNSGESNQDTSFAWLEPAAPTNFAATSNNCNSITLTWTDAPLFATSYVIVRDGSTLDNSVSPGLQMYVDSTASVGLHLYQINAGNICTLSQPDTTSGERLGPPEMPTGYSVSVDSCNGIHLRWNDTATEDFFVVLRDGISQDTLVSGNTEFDDLTVDAGVDYNYCVYGINECGDGSDVCANGMRAETPPPVLGLTVTTDNCDGALLVWPDLDGELFYHIYRDGNPVAIHTNDADDTNYVDTGVAPGETHSYRVSASNVCGEGLQSDSISGSRNAPPVTPVNCQAVANCDGITFNWSDVAGETSYEVRRNGSLVATLAANVTVYVDNDPPFGTNGYCVRACNACGCSEDCCDTAEPITLPGIPINVSATDTGCVVIRVSWTAVDNLATGFEIWRDDSFLIAVAAGVTFYDDSPAAGTYLYKVAAIRDECGSNGFSNEDSGRRIGVPAVPTGLTASSNQCNFIGLQWSPAAEADSYSVIRDDVVIAHVTTTSYQDNSATPGTHFYRLRALNHCDSSALTNPAVSGIRLGVPPQVPAISATDTRCDNVRITWTLVTGATSYVVRREGIVIVTQPGDSSGYSDNTAVVGTTYSYNVTANNTCGDAPGSVADNGTRVLSPQIPTAVQATDTRCDSIVVTWTIPAPPGDIDTFEVLATGVPVGGVIGTATRFAYAPAPGTSADYSVRARSTECGVGTPSAVNPGSRPAAPAQVQNVTTLAPQCDVIGVQWNALNPQPDRYLVWRDSVIVDSTTLTTYQDAGVDDARNHRYHVTARNACGVSLISAGTNGSELPLFRITGNLPDEVFCDSITSVAVTHCPGVTTDSVSVSLDGGPYQFLVALPGNQNNLTFVIPHLPQLNTTARLRIVSFRAARRDTLLSETINVTCPDAADDDVSLIPSEFYLDQNFPNPFNPSTTIRFGLPKSSEVRVEVFELSGRLAATLVDGFVDAGTHSVTWDCADCPSGMYLLRMSTSEQVLMRKMLLMK